MKIKIFCMLLLSAMIFHCKSNSLFIIKIERPNDEISIAKPGDVLISTSRAERGATRNKVIYIFWRFTSADKKSLKLTYEEYYSNLKDKADLSDEKVFTIEKEKNSFPIDNYNLLVYELMPKKMVYVIKRK